MSFGSCEKYTTQILRAIYSAGTFQTVSPSISIIEQQAISKWIPFKNKNDAKHEMSISKRDQLLFQGLGKIEG